LYLLLCLVPAILNETSKLPGVGIPASPEVNPPVNFWILILLYILVTIDVAFAEISVVLSNILVLASILFRVSKVAAACSYTGVFVGTDDPNMMQFVR
jgi:hypothetical protein